MIDAEQRLRNERQLLKTQLPAGFVAKPLPQKVNGAPSKNEIDYFSWICGIPGRSTSLYAGSTLLVFLLFPPEYPTKAPKAVFSPVLIHPNCYPSGAVCLSLINEATWKSDISIKEILIGLQMWLDEPNLASPAQKEAYDLLKKDKAEYQRKVKEFASRYPTIGFQERIMKLVKSGEYMTATRRSKQQQYFIDFD